MKKVYLPVLSILFFILHFAFKCSAQNSIIYGILQSSEINGDGVLFGYNLNTSAQKTLVNFTGNYDGAFLHGGLTFDTTTGYLYGMTSLGGTHNLGTLFNYTTCVGASTIINFQSNNAAAHPYGNLVYDTANGLFYGMTSQGGTDNDGVIFSFDPTTNTESVLVNFNGTNGANPYGNLTMDPINGLFYGMTYSGGYSYGTIFEFDPNTNAQNVVSYFDTILYAYAPYGSLTWDPTDSLFVGMTSGEDGGALFYYNPKTNYFYGFTNFRYIWGDEARGNLTYDPVNEDLYGMTTEGPSFNAFGNVFYYAPTPLNQYTFATPFSFNGSTEGKYPYGSFTWDPATELFYGTTKMGGTSDSGVMYSFNPTTFKETVLINFNKANGALPYGELMYDPATQMLYGMTYAGGTNNDGVIYKYTPTTNSETVLTSFNGTNGANPWGDLTYDPINGELYGMTLNGGANGTGAIFMFDTAATTQTVEYNFTPYTSNENTPYGKLVVNPADGQLYGLSLDGGSNNYGTLFRVNPLTDKDTTLLSFNNTAYPLGANPMGNLVYDTANSLFYGMTSYGGTSNDGVIFSFNPITGKDSTLVNFTGANGQSPYYTALTYDPSTNLLYGMTGFGGTYNYGVLFSVNPTTNIETVLYNFDYTTTSGANPYNSLTYNPVDGLLYGTTPLGGTNDGGVIFSFNTNASTFTIRHNFEANISDGYIPESSLAFNPADSNFYGTTYLGGTSDDGILYKFNALSNTETILESFDINEGRPYGMDLLITNSLTPFLAILSTETTNVSCNGGSNGSASPIVSGGTAPYTYSWSNGAGTNATANNLSALSYTVTVHDSCGSSATASVTITQPEALRDSIVSTSITNITCNGNTTGSATVRVKYGTTPYTYLWSNGAGTTATANNLSAISYTVTVHDSCGSSATASVTITQPASLSIAISSDTNILCNGNATGAVIANGATGGTSPYTYTWSGGILSTDTAAEGLTTGAYAITVKDMNGCSATASATITQPSAIRDSIVSISYPLCIYNPTGSATIGVKGGISPYTYSWYPPVSSISTASGLSAQTYTVGITDNNSCSQSLTVLITQPEVLRDSIADSVNTACNGSPTGSATIGVKYGTTPYTYLWSDASLQTTATATGLSAGIYTVTVNDSCGSSATDSVTIVLNTDSSAIGDYNYSFCAGYSETLTNNSADYINNGGSLTYLWNFGDTALGSADTSSASEPNVTYPVAGTYTISLFPYPPITCHDTATLVVTVDSLPPISLHTNYVFADSTVTFTDWDSAIIGGPEYFIIYQFYDSAIGITANIPSLPMFSVTSPTFIVHFPADTGTYAIVYGVATSIFGCANVDTLYITLPTLGIQPIGGSISKLNIYPNPNNGMFTLSYSMSSSDNVQISIIDELGQIVYLEQKQTGNGQNTEQLNLENLATGIYSLRMQTNSGIAVRKLVIMGNR